MNKTDVTPLQRRLIEELGVAFESLGTHNPTEARIAALLIVADEIELTFDEIREILCVSKSAVSNALSMLLAKKTIIYYTKPGDRKRYFKSMVAEWHLKLDEKFKEMLSVRTVLKKILAQRPNTTPEFNKGMEEWIDFMTYIQDEFSNGYAKWKENKNINN